MQTPKGEINDKIMELIDDEAVFEEMAKASGPQACYEIVKDRIGISFEEFQASMTVALAYLKENTEGELSEDDLDSVAGGKANNNQQVQLKRWDIVAPGPANNPSIYHGGLENAVM